MLCRSGGGQTRLQLGQSAGVEPQLQRDVPHGGADGGQCREDSAQAIVKEKIKTGIQAKGQTAQAHPRASNACWRHGFGAGRIAPLPAVPAT